VHPISWKKEDEQSPEKWLRQQGKKQSSSGQCPEAFPPVIVNPRFNLKWTVVGVLNEYNFRWADLGLTIRLPESWNHLFEQKTVTCTVTFNFTDTFIVAKFPTTKRVSVTIV
jgi:hypothetical protein